MKNIVITRALLFCMLISIGIISPAQLPVDMNKVNLVILENPDSSIDYIKNEQYLFWKKARPLLQFTSSAQAIVIISFNDKLKIKKIKFIKKIAYNDENFNYSKLLKHIIKNGKIRWMVDLFRNDNFKYITILRIPVLQIE